ncbi:hypothetical protein ACKFKG_29985 [Phormidesmis sp. 146-35]
MAWREDNRIPNPKIGSSVQGENNLLLCGFGRGQVLKESRTLSYYPYPKGWSAGMNDRLFDMCGHTLTLCSPARGFCPQLDGFCKTLLT